MRTFSSSSLLLLGLGSLSSAAPTRRQNSQYAPVTTTCPSTQLVRQADGISNAEKTYISQRHAKASQALASWLKNIDSGFAADTQQSEWGQWANQPSVNMPKIALTSSGGGYRAQLVGAGVVKGFDGREANRTAVSGLYQALSYHAGLSGGSWLLSSIAGNDYPTITQLQTSLWETALQNSLLAPPILLSQAAEPIYNQVLNDVQSKYAAGYDQSIIDPWGRLLSYGLLLGADGGVADTMSGIASSSNFSAHLAPYPIITALGSNINIDGQCPLYPNATQYEFHPYEFGSWDEGVNAFAVSEYIGTEFSAGQPTGQCVTHYDQLGYVLGTSSNVFASTCGPLPANKTAEISALSLLENLAYLVAPGQPGVSGNASYGRYPNPFQNFESSPLVAGQTTLDLVDGGVGEAPQGDPLWPLLNRPDVDVVLVSANSADTTGNFPNGSEVRNTYEAATAAGLTRMPFVPTADVWVSEGLNQRPVFFGCNDNETITLIDIPNYAYSFPSGQLTAKIQYFVNETRGMIDNGVQVANYGGKENWPLCLACGIMKKSGGSLPDGCEDCFAEYCYN